MPGTRKQIRFHRPVVIQPGRIDRDRVVTTVAGAANVLLHEWPNTDGASYTKAIKACIDVIRSEKPPRVARKAFIDAAKEARIFLGENP